MTFDAGWKHEPLIQMTLTEGEWRKVAHGLHLAAAFEDALDEPDEVLSGTVGLKHRILDTLENEVVA